MDVTLRADPYCSGAFLAHEDVTILGCHGVVKPPRVVHLGPARDTVVVGDDATELDRIAGAAAMTAPAYVQDDEAGVPGAQECDPVTYIGVVRAVVWWHHDRADEPRSRRQSASGGRERRRGRRTGSEGGLGFLGSSRRAEPPGGCGHAA